MSGPARQHPLVHFEIKDHEQYVDSNKKTFTSYVINITVQRGDEKQKYIARKRFNDFRRFDTEWGKLYPGPHKERTLPSTNNVNSILLKNSQHVIQARKGMLEQYLWDVASVKALQPLLAQFLGIPFDSFSQKQITFNFDQEQAKIKVATGAPQKGGYVYTTEARKKGNDDDAERKARLDKEKFLSENRGLIEALMPGRSYNLGIGAFTVDKTVHHTGQLLLAVWYNEKEVCIKLHISKARDLAASTNKLDTSPYVKVYCLPDPEKLTKRKTRTQMRTVNPSFEESMSIPMSKDELNKKALEIAVWDAGNALQHYPIGKVVFHCDQLPTAAVICSWYSLSPPDLIEATLKKTSSGQQLSSMNNTSNNKPHSAPITPTATTRQFGPSKSQPAKLTLPASSVEPPPARPGPSKTGAPPRLPPKASSSSAPGSPTSSVRGLPLSFRGKPPASADSSPSPNNQASTLFSSSASSSPSSPSPSPSPSAPADGPSSTSRAALAQRLAPFRQGSRDSKTDNVAKKPILPPKPTPPPRSLPLSSPSNPSPSPVLTISEQAAERAGPNPNGTAQQPPARKFSPPVAGNGPTPPTNASGRAASPPPLPPKPTPSPSPPLPKASKTTTTVATPPAPTPPPARKMNIATGFGLLGKSYTPASLSELQEIVFKDGNVDPCIELRLTEDEFRSVFFMTRKQWKDQPEKRKRKKKLAKGLWAGLDMDYGSMRGRSYAGKSPRGTFYNMQLSSSVPPRDFVSPS
eukprot:g1749.t1